MKALRIRGGRPLRGTVDVSGAKNAALPLMCCALLTDEPLILRGLPDLQDVRSMERLLGLLGVGIHDTVEGNGCVLRVRQPQAEPLAPYELVRTMRASVLVLGPLLARRGRAVVSLPGGCAIGARPIDQHLQALTALGADIDVREGYVHATCSRLRGSRISFDLPTVGGTENLMMAAALAEGETVLENAAREPEIVALAELLQRMGICIEGAGTSTIRIEGRPSLSGAETRVIPDRIEAGTWLIAAAATGGDVRVRHCRPDHLEVLLEKLAQAGCDLDVDDLSVRLRAPGTLRPCDIRTAPFPGFPTDLQAQWMSLMTVADGATEIVETIFENRFMHVPELIRMGASIRVTGNVAVVRGPTTLSGAPVMATDLRASAGLVIAGLAATGTTEILRIYHLERGYERLDAKLRGLGADVEMFSRDATVAHLDAAGATDDRRTT